MTNARKFPCTIVHTGLFPTPLLALDPFNPLKVKVLVEVSKDNLFVDTRRDIPLHAL